MRKYLILLLLMATSAAAQHGDGSLPYTVGPAWHWLQDIYAADGGITLDSDNDGVPDKANNLQVNSSGTVRVFRPAAGSVLLNLDGFAGHQSTLSFLDGGASGWTLGRAASGNFQIDRIGAGNALTIEPASRNVGIGTMSPVFKIHANAGSGNNWIASFQSGVDGTGNRQELLLGYNSLSDYAVISGHHQNVAWTNLILQPNGGNVGIGTITPRRSLEINGQIINTNAVNANPNLIQYDVGVGSVGASTVYGYSAVCTGNNFGSCAGAGGTVLGVANALAQNNIPNGGNVFFNRNGGNLGIGTTAPAQKLDVAGNIRATGDICTDQGGGKCLSTASGSVGAFAEFGGNCPNTGGSEYFLTSAPRPQYKVCFLSTVYVHDDQDNNRQQGCRIDYGNPGSFNLYCRWNAGGSPTVCRMVCLE